METGGVTIGMRVDWSVVWMECAGGLAGGVWGLGGRVVSLVYLYVEVERTRHRAYYYATHVTRRAHRTL